MVFLPHFDMGRLPRGLHEPPHTGNSPFDPVSLFAERSEVRRGAPTFKHQLHAVPRLADTAFSARDDGEVRVADGHAANGYQAELLVAPSRPEIEVMALIPRERIEGIPVPCGHRPIFHPLALP